MLFLPDCYLHLEGPRSQSLQDEAAGNDQSHGQMLQKVPQVTRVLQTMKWQDGWRRKLHGVAGERGTGHWSSRTSLHRVLFGDLTVPFVRHTKVYCEWHPIFQGTCLIPCVNSEGLLSLGVSWYCCRLQGLLAGRRIWGGFKVSSVSSNFFYF